MNSSEIDAKSSKAGTVGNSRVHMRAGEEYNSAHFTDDPNLRIEFHLLLRMRLLASIRLDLLRSAGPAFFVPPIIIVLPGAVLHRLSPVVAMKSHTVFGDNVVNRNPPVDL